MLKKPIAWLILACIVFVGFFTWLNYTRYKSLFALEWGDEAVHNQLAYRTFRHGLFTSTLKGDQVFDQHFRPAWLIIALAYLPFPTIISWYFLQAAAFAGVAIALFFWTLGKRNDPWAALLFALAVLFYPPIHQLMIGVYDPEKFVVFFLLLTLLAFQRRKFGWFIAGIVLCLCCKEIIGFTVIMFGVMLAVTKKPIKYWVSAISLAILWLILAYGFVIPATMDVGYGSKYFPQLLGSDCESPVCVIKHAVTNPITTAGILFSGEHLRILALLFLPLAALCVLAPSSLIPTLASLGMILSVPGPLLINQHHWFAPALPFIFVGTIAGAWKIAEWAEGRREKFGVTVFRGIPVLLIGLSLLFSLFGGFVGRFHDDKLDDHYYAALSSPFDKRIYEISNRDMKAWELIRQVPDDTRVTANYDLMAPLATRQIIKEFGRNAHDYDYFEFDFILINLKDRYYGAGHDVRLHKDDLDRLADEIRSGRVKTLYCDPEFFLGQKLTTEHVTPPEPEQVSRYLVYLKKAADLAYEKIHNLGYADIRD